MLLTRYFFLFNEVQELVVSNAWISFRLYYSLMKKHFKKITQQMQEIFNKCSWSKKKKKKKKVTRPKRNSTSAEIRHFRCYYTEALVLTCFHLTKDCIKFFNRRKLLRVSGIWRCYFSKWKSIILLSISFMVLLWCVTVNLVSCIFANDKHLYICKQKNEYLLLKPEQMLHKLISSGHHFAGDEWG